MTHPKRRLNNPISAGSMADIAFLLLIFFLVTTTIDMDKGILVNLPRWIDKPIPTPLPDDNVLTIKINFNNELLVEGETASIENLKEQTKEFIMNPHKREDLPSNPRRAIISLQNDRGTAYQAYLEVYNEIRAAYNELWEEVAQRRFQKKYDLLEKHLQKEIRAKIPLVISEAEPSDHISEGS